MIFTKKRKNAPTPIETSLGILKGRDCIYLDKVYKKDRSYLFEGEINGRLLNNDKDGFIKYKLEFKNVISMFTCELDSYDAINTNSVYSFEIIENGKYLTFFNFQLPICLSLSLFVFWVFTNNCNSAFSFNNFAFVAHRFY